MSDFLNPLENEKHAKWDTAAEILGLKGKEFFGGIERCEFTVEQLSGILGLSIAPPVHSCNGSPAVDAYFKFGKQAEESGATVRYIGFLESKSRKDAIAVIEGISITKFPNSASLILDFAQLFHSADEFTANAEQLYAWYD
jgi:hypothetical protein